MKITLILTLLAALFCFTNGIVSADEFFIYPAKGQSNEQMAQDKFQCYEWAKGQSGFDPMAPPTASTPPPKAEAPKGGVVKGAAGGALVGVTVGAIAGNSRKGAQIGAASGALLGGMKRAEQKEQQKQKEEQWAREEANRYQQGRDSYNRAYKACLVGREYTVN